MKNLSLCLSGGAARGAYHLGLLSFFYDNKIEFDVFSGSSIGAVIASSYASGVNPIEQLRIFKSKDFRDSIKFNYLLNGVFTIEKEAPIFKELLPISKLEEIPKPVYICVYDYKNKQLLYYSKGDTFDLCIASCSLFPLFKMTKYDNRLLLDGGMVDNLPIRPLENKTNKICSIDLLPRGEKSMKKSHNPIKFLKKIAFKTLYQNINYSISKTDVYITNSILRDYKLFTFDNIDALFKIAYKDGSKYLSSLNK